MRTSRRINRRPWWLLIGVLSILFVSLAVVLARTIYASIASSNGSSSIRPAHSIPNTDVNPYGANFFLSREVEPWKIDKTLQMASEAGIGWVKQHFPWEAVEPLRKGEFVSPATKTDSWAQYDLIVETCEKYGLRIIARLDRPPDWTRQDNTYQERPPDNLEDYGDYVFAFVKRYAGRIDYIQVWNEPNIFPEWGNRPVDPAGYVDLLRVAYRRAKEANPNVYVLSAPLAITLGQAHPDPGQWISMSDLQFLEGMYEAGAAPYFDIYSANAFGMDRSPYDPPDPNTLNFQRVLLQRRIMERYGDADKAIWFNEYGWNAAPETFAPEHLVWRRVGEKEQAEYTLQGIALAHQEWPWAGVFNIWYFRQVGNIPPDRADYYFRMVDVDFTPRPLYFAVQDVASEPTTPGPGRYEETNPNVQRYGRWYNVIDESSSAKAYIRSEREGDSIAFDFRGAGADLIAHRGPSSGQLLISLDGRSVPGLPTDAQGFGIVDLYNPIDQYQARVPLVRVNGGGEHTLRIRVAGTRNAASTGQLCDLDAFEVLPQEQTPFPVLPILGLILALGSDGWLLWRLWRRVQWTVRAP
jgi:hypothetical protein